MKTMRLERLFLVRPKRYPHADASARAGRAGDVLADAVVCDSLDEALQGVLLVIGTSARSRSLEWPHLDLHECATRLIQESAAGDVALVFGRECSGLTNAELDRCHFVTMIPCSSEYCSLNLAGAVQVVSYELLMAAGLLPRVTQPLEPTATADEVELFYRHLEQTLIAIRFLDSTRPEYLMRRLRRLFNRIRLTRNELNILRGILTAVRTNRSS
jgi:TrmH family RNA methyltransferase